MTTSSRVAYWSVMALAFLAPLFFIPSALLPLGVAKVILFTLGGVVALGALIVSFIKTKRIVMPRTALLWAALVLPVIYIASTVASPVRWLSFFGYALEPGTAASILVLFAILLSTAIVARDRLSVMRVLTAIFASLSILGLFLLLRVFSGGSLFASSLWSGIIGNPLGVWTDVGMAFGLLAILACFAIEMLHLERLGKLLVWGAFVVSIIILCVANFSTAWWLILSASVVTLVYLTTLEPLSSGEGARSRPGMWMAGIMAFAALLFIWNPNIGGVNLGNRVAAVSGIANADVRPNFSATLAVAKSVVSKNPVLGSGPNTFDHDWLMFRPADTNATPFWNVAFPFGFGFLPTAAATTGLLGLLAWTLFLILIISLGVKAIKRGGESRSDRFLSVATFISSLFLWIGAVFYTPSFSVLVITFMMTGLFLAALAATGVVGVVQISSEAGAVARFASVLAVLILVAGMAIFSFTSLNKVLAASYFARAVASSNTAEKTVNDVEAELGKALRTSPNDEYWVAVSQVELARANQALNDTSTSTAARQQEFQNALTASIGSLQNAIALNPSYGNWIALGNLYSSLVAAPLAVDGAYDAASSAYDSAETANPMSPEVPLLKARLELAKNNPDKARALISEALKRKSDYADAYFLLAQLEIGENNIAEAIKSADTGALLSPANAGVFYEIGLLKYSNKDYAGAVEAFQKALSISPDYANAKYYLGLTLSKLGRLEEALAQFEDIEKTNPDNELVMMVIKNLRAGKDALSGVDQTPSGAAPISQ